jgi:hypothetical protein
MVINKLKNNLIKGTKITIEGTVREILIRYTILEHFYLMPFVMVVKIVRRLNIVFILYSKKRFSLKLFLNCMSIILGTVYIVYVENPTFMYRIKDNKIAIISSFLSSASSLSADLILGKKQKII